MDGQNGVLLVLGAGEHDLDGEGLESLLESGQALFDARRLALVARLRRHLPEHAEILGLTGEFGESRDRTGEVRPLLHDLLGLAAVVPEARGRHLLIDYREARFLGFEVKDAPGGPACVSRPRRGCVSDRLAFDAASSSERHRPRRRGERDAQVDEPVPEACVEGGAGAEGDREGEEAALEEREDRAHAPVGSDEGGHPGVGGPRDGDAVFHGAKGQRAQMLPGPARAPEPRVVGDVGHEARASAREASEQVGEDHFVTDHRAETRFVEPEYRLGAAGREIRDELRPLPDEADDRGERYVLAEWYELNLIILAGNALISQQKSAVEKLAIGPGKAVHRAHEDGDTRLPDEGNESREQRGVATEEDGRGRLRPEHGSGSALRRLTREALIHAEDLRLMRGIPLLLLLDHGLDDGDLDGARRSRLRTEVVRKGAPPEAEREPEQGRRRDGAEHGSPRPEDAKAGDGRVHRHEEKRDRVHAAELRDLDHGESGVLRVAEEAPGEAAHEPTADPFPGDPQDGRSGQRPARAEPGPEPRDYAPHDAQVEAAVRGEGGDGQPRHWPGNRAVVLEGEVEPAEQHHEEHRAGEPAVPEGTARAAPESAAESGHEPEPREEMPVRRGKGERARHAREHERNPARPSLPEDGQRARLPGRGARRGREAGRPRGSWPPPPYGRRRLAAASPAAPPRPTARRRRGDRDHGAGPRCPR